jgi:hypothetical protein
MNRLLVPIGYWSIGRINVLLVGYEEGKLTIEWLTFSRGGPHSQAGDHAVVAGNPFRQTAERYPRTRGDALIKGLGSAFLLSDTGSAAAA